LKALSCYLPGRTKEITKISVKLFVVATELKIDTKIQVGYIYIYIYIYIRIHIYIYTYIYIYIYSFYVGVRLGLLQEAKNIGRRCLRTGWLGINLGLRWSNNRRLEDITLQWRSWLKHCATSRKVAGSIPHGVIRFFHWHNPSGRTIALGSTQPLKEMSTRNVS